MLVSRSVMLLQSTFIFGKQPAQFISNWRFHFLEQNTSHEWNTSVKLTLLVISNKFLKYEINTDDFVVVWVIVRVCSVVLRRTVVVDWRFDNLRGSHHQSKRLYVIIRVKDCKLVETSVNTNNSPSQDYTTNPDDHSNHNIDSPGFKPFTVILMILKVLAYLQGPLVWKWVSSYRTYTCILSYLSQTIKTWKPT